MTRLLVFAISAVSAVIIALLIFASLRTASKGTFSVPVLMYHDVGETAGSAWCVPVDTFRAQMIALREQGFKTILPSDIAANRQREKPLPRKPVIITFDDGYLSSLNVVEPILKEHGFRAVAYLITSKISETPELRYTYENKPCLVWPEVLAMQKRRIFAFGGHSHSHGNLSSSVNPLPDITECLKQLKLHGIRKPFSFCYPFGQYNQKTIKAVREAGFQTAVVCEDAVAVIGPATNLFALPRVSVMGGSHEFKFLNKEADAKGTGLIYRILHTGIPLEISACLRGNGKDLWLPAREISRGEFLLQFTLPDAGAAHAQYTLEIWDKHRLFKLATVNR